MNQEIIVNGQSFSYTTNDLGDKYGDGSVVRVICPKFDINEEFAAEDMPEILEFVIAGKLKQSEPEKKVVVSLRLWEQDLNFIKEYAQKHGEKYQQHIRKAVKQYREELVR